MEKTKIKNLPEEKEVSKEEMKKVMGGKGGVLAEFELLGGLDDDTSPEPGGSIRA